MNLLNWRILPIGGVLSGRICIQPAKQACLGNDDTVYRTVTVTVAGEHRLPDDLTAKYIHKKIYIKKK